MDRHDQHLAVAFVRGHLHLPRDLPPAQVLDAGLRAGLKLHAFKSDKRPLPRVSKVLGMLRGLGPLSLLDIGPGRGAFLWPLLNTFPALELTAIDRNPQVVRDVVALHRGGYETLHGAVMTVQELALPDKRFDGVTMLEVLEHLPKPEAAARELVRVARRFAILSVPSKEDDNPQHIQLFKAASLEEIFLRAGARRVQCNHVLNHIIAFVGLS